MDFEQKNRVYKSVMLIIVTALITFLVTSMLVYNYITKTDQGIAKVVTTIQTSDLDTKVKLIKAYKK